MNPPKKLTTQHKTEEQQETLGAQQEQSAQAGQEFGTVEQMLRHDALHTPVPPTIGQRLEKSLKELGGATAPWWRRLFGGSK
jgi:hypothetical protein